MKILKIFSIIIFLFGMMASMNNVFAGENVHNVYSALNIGASKSTSKPHYPPQYPVHCFHGICL